MKGAEFRKKRRKESGKKKGSRKKEEKRSARKVRGRTRWWSKIRKRFVGVFTVKRKELEEEKKCGSKVRYSKARQGLGRRGRWLFLLFLLGQGIMAASAAAEGSQRRTAVVFRM